MLVHGRGNCQVGDRAEVGQVEHAVVGRSVFSYQPGTIQAEHNGEFEYGDIMNDIVVSTLHE